MKTTKELIIADITAKVEAKLAKIELASHQVELAILDDLKKNAQDMINSLGVVGEQRLVIIGARNKMNQAIINSENITNNLEKSLATYLQQVKDLGIEQVPAIAKNIQNEISKARKSNKKDLQEYIKSK
jgi:FlaA1/EpsC-like NDP-sugar epimerase